ncbi:hypothetical protein JG688_00017789 [Phytophthora aleatoria]|uniref:Uncharacterized protein n=1 Tax=Phytophthora aleatoria TaxID=2496075 RepID=A0A8J5MBJ1_9STRA|nr:hypothetical protein JG688_00017789 [Phytophthora aleatoria]
MLRQCELDHSQIIIPRSSTQDTLSLNCTSKGERLSVPGDITCPDPVAVCESELGKVSKVFFSLTEWGLTSK